MKAVADTLGVARSNLAAQAQRGGSRPRPRYRRAGDAELLARIRPLVDARPSYGYRRITALLNRHADAEGLARVNHKRVYRVMKRAGLLLAPHTGRGRHGHTTARLRRRLEPALGCGCVRDPVLER